MNIADAISSALFVMLVVFIGLIILYVLVKLFTYLVRNIEKSFISGDDAKKGA